VPQYSGNRLILNGLIPGSTVTLTFPVASSTEDYTVGGRMYTLKLRGSTVVDVTPRSENHDTYQYYRRSEMERTTAPMKEVTRFVADKILPLQ